MQITTTDIVISSIATYRAVKLWLDDEITEELRDKAYDEVAKIKNEKIRSKAEYLLGCPWCLSVYAGAFLIGLRFVAPKTAAYLNAILAASAVTGTLYEKL